LQFYDGRPLTFAPGPPAPGPLVLRPLAPGPLALMLPRLLVGKPLPTISATLSLRLLSTLLLILLELLLLLCFLSSFGSLGLNPLALAKRLRTSVRLTMPVSWPDSIAPGRADAETAGEGVAVNGGLVLGVASVYGEMGGTRTAGVETGVGGPDEDGEGDSTIHML
jgi:hypothetical protein